MSIFGRRPDPEAVATQLIEGLESGDLTLDDPTEQPAAARVRLEPGNPSVPILISFERYLYRVTNHGPGGVRVSFKVPNRNGEHHLSPGASIDLEASEIEVGEDNQPPAMALVEYAMLWNSTGKRLAGVPTGVELL